MEITRCLPFDMIEGIAKCLDVQTLPKFRCCCKDANIAASEKIYTETLTNTINKRLVDIIEIITQYHTELRKPEVRTTIIRKILIEFYSKARNNHEMWNPYTNDMIQMIRRIIDKTACNENDVNRVWFLYMNNYEISNDDEYIVKALEDYTFQRWYSLLFQFTDCKNQGKHYIQLEVDFTDEDKPKLGFTMQEIINDKDMCKADVDKLFDIQDAVYDVDGFIRFEVTDYNIKAMSKFIVTFMGPDVFVFETDMVSYIRSHSYLWLSVGEEFIEKQLNQFADREQYRDKLIEILDNLE
jgi:hypothetical protein